MEDPRWGDVNVVSSLLKSFFRKLPEPLFTLELYPAFIEASKIEEPTLRLHTLRKLVRSLPDANFETLRYVCGHLCKVMAFAEINLMDLKNLAIVFGPTLVRTSDDNMLAMVTDMAHQCRIIESMLSACQWFFEDAQSGTLGGRRDSNAAGGGLLGVDSVMATSLPPGELLAARPGGIPVPAGAGGRSVSLTQTANESLLLNNLHKLEEAGKVSSHKGGSGGGGASNEVSARDIVSGIISAANRKIQRGQHSSSSSSAAVAAAAASGKAKKESEDLSAARLARLDTPPTRVAASPVTSGHNESRRNSESVIHGAVAIASAVPKLMGGAGMEGSSASASASSVPERLRHQKKRGGGGGQANISASAENINSSSSSAAVSVVVTSSGAPGGGNYDATKSSSPFPFDSYQVTKEK